MIPVCTLYSVDTSTITTWVNSVCNDWTGHLHLDYIPQQHMDYKSFFSGPLINTPLASCKNLTPPFILRHVSHREYTELTMYEGSDAPLGNLGIHSRDPPDLGREWILEYVNFPSLKFGEICVFLLSSCHTPMCYIKCFLWPCMSWLTFSKQPQHLHNNIAPPFTYFLPSLTQHLCVKDGDDPSSHLSGPTS